MKSDKPSFTAAAVAAFRTAGRLLPPDARLIEDPFGIDFAPPALRAVVNLGIRFPDVGEWVIPRLGPLYRLLMWMQVRTRLLDDELLRFVRCGGRQVLLLGAGFDARAVRFAGELEGVSMFEVDHPATQAQKRAVLARRGAPDSRSRYIEWDFERRPMAELPAHLKDLGHDPSMPTLTIWEGVTMYLTEQALDASVAAVRALSAEGSPFAMTYFTPRTLRKARVGVPFLHRNEPYRSAWERGAIGEWLAAREFHLRDDHGADDLARTYLPDRYAPHFSDGRRIAIAVRMAGS